ncbi:MAG: shikimate kinase [Endomicrobium sp.]|jgi:shikimate kinase|nr:shikimate kinase [Endomicrobium sp.]
MKHSVVLIGFMGTGKTQVGKVLAQRLNRNFFDTDNLIEEKIGMKISDIFKKFKESGFRQIEARIVKKVAKENSAVISCGGGVVLNKNNIEILREKGIIINLYASCNVIYERIKNSSTQQQHPCPPSSLLPNDTLSYVGHPTLRLAQANRKQMVGDRPILMCKKPLAKIKELLDIRKEAYANCEFSFNTDGLSIQEVVSGLMDKLNSLYFIV